MAQAKAGHVDRRRRMLTSQATVHAVLSLCLFSAEDYNSVLKRAWPLLGGAAVVDGAVPAGFGAVPGEGAGGRGSGAAPV